MSDTNSYLISRMYEEERLCLLPRSNSKACAPNISHSPWAKFARASQDPAFSSSHHHRLLDLLSMALWFMRFRTFVRIVLTLLSVGFPLLGLAVACAMLYRWIQVPPGDVYYVEHDYLPDAVLWGVLSLGSLLAAGRVLFVREARLRWLWLPITMSFVMIMVPNQGRHAVFPSLDGPGRSYRISLSSVHNELTSLYYDLQPAVERGEAPPCVSGPTDRVSPYSRAGVRLVYQRVCVTTDLPLDSLLASSAPGTLYVIMRPGDPTVRLRATVLPRNEAATPSWASAFFGRGPMELTISPQAEPRANPPVHRAAVPMSSEAAPTVRPPQLPPHTNH